MLLTNFEPPLRYSSLILLKMGVLAMLGLGAPLSNPYRRVAIQYTASITGNTNLQLLKIYIFIVYESSVNSCEI